MQPQLQQLQLQTYSTSLCQAIAGARLRASVVVWLTLAIMAGYGFSPPTTPSQNESATLDLSSSNSNSTYGPARSGEGGRMMARAASSAMPAIGGSRPSSRASSVSRNTGGTEEYIMFPPPGLPTPRAGATVIPQFPMNTGSTSTASAQADDGPNIYAQYNSLRVDANVQQNVVVGVDPQEAIAFAANAAAAQHLTRPHLTTVLTHARAVCARPYTRPAEAARHHDDARLRERDPADHGDGRLDERDDPHDRDGARRRRRPDAA